MAKELLNSYNSKSFQKFKFKGNCPCHKTRLGILDSCLFRVFIHLVKSLLNQFKRPANVWFLVSSTLLLSFSVSPLAIAPLVCILTLNLAVDTFDDLKTQKHFLSTKTTKVWNGKDFADQKKALPKDIVLLKKGEKAMSSILVFCASPYLPEVCIDVSEVFGDSNLRVKKPVKDTQLFLESEDLEEVSEQLQGLEFVANISNPNQDFTNFEGKVKIKSFPQACKVNYENLVLRGSVICSEWVLGMVVDFESKKPQKHLAKNPDLENKLSGITWVLLGVMVLMLGLHLLLGNLNSSETEPFILQVLHLLYLFNYLVPLPLLVSLDLTRIFQMLYIKKALPKFTSNSSKFNEDFARTEFLLVNRKCLLEDSKLKLDFCFVGGNLYQDSVDSQSFSQLRELTNSQYKLFFLALAACDATSLCQKIKKKESNTILEFLNFLGIQVSEEKSTLNLRINSNSEEFSVLASQNFVSETLKTRVVVQNDKSCFLLVKGPKKEMLNLVESNSLQRVLEYQELSSRRFIVYGFKELTSEEIPEFLHLYDNARLNPVSPESSLEKVFEHYEKDLEFLGAIGVQESISNLTTEAVSHLKEAGVKMWLLTEEKEEVCQSLAFATGISDPSVPTLEINASSSEDLKAQLKECLNTSLFSPNEQKSPVSPQNFRKRIGKVHPFILDLLDDNSDFFDFQKEVSRKRFNLEVSGQAFEAVDNYQNKIYLGILMLLAESVTLSSFTPFQKKQAVLFLKTFCSKSVTLGVGKSNAHLPMMSSTDLCVAIDNESSPDVLAFANFSLKGLKDLPELLSQSKKFYSNSKKIVWLCLYKVFLMVALNFLFGFYSGFSGFYVFDRHLYLGVCVLQSLPVIALGIYNQPQSPEPYLNPKKLVLIGIEGTLHSLVSFFMFKLAYNSAFNKEGFNYDYQIWSLVLAGVTFLTITFRVLHYTKLPRVPILLGHLVSVLGFVLLLVFWNLEAVVLLLKSPKLVVLVLTIPAINLILVFFSEHIKSYLLPKKDFETIVKMQIKKYLSSANKLFSTQDSQTHEEKFKINPWTLCFYSKHIQNRYFSIRLVGTLKRIRVFLVKSLIATGLFQAWALVQLNLSLSGKILISVSTSVLLLFLYFSFTRIARKFTSAFVSILEIYLLVVFSGICQTFESASPVMFSLMPVLLYIVLYVDFVQSTVLNLLGFVTVLVNSTIYFHKYPEVYLRLAHFNVTYLGIALTCGIVAYKANYSHMKSYSLTKQVETKKNKALGVLDFLFPKFVAKRVLKDESSISMAQPSVTIIFCDICEFEQIVEYFSPQELTAFLDFLFKKLDRLCSLFGVSKIETVGYTYMACAGIIESEKDLDSELKNISHATRVFEMGVAILREVNGMFWKGGRPLQVKIGINTGKVTAGVVGHHKPQFALVGDAVNTCSRMASTLEIPNSIQLSKDTYELLENSSGLKLKKKKAEVKGKGIMTTYYTSLKMKSSAIQRINTHYVKAIRSFRSKRHPNTSLPKQEDSCDNLQKLQSKFFKALDKKTPKQRRSKQEKSRVKTIRIILPMIKLGSVVFLVTQSLSLGMIILELFISQNLSLFDPFLTLVSVFALGALFNSMKKRWKTPWFGWLFQLTLLSIYLALVIESSINYFYTENVTLLLLYYLLFMSQCSLLSTKKTLITVALGYIGIIAFELSADSSISDLLITIFFLGYLVFTLFLRRKQTKAVSLVKNTLKQNLLKAEGLLARLLPSHVYANLKKENAVTDKYYEETILYADIVGFTSWSSDKLPDEILGMLSGLFTEFDQACVKHQVYKVHTIGDCYVVMGSDFEDPSVRCSRVVEFAKEMLRIIQKVNQENDFELDMRIGIHSGEVTAGISGTSIVRYDIYGPDVLVANKVESNGKPGKIVVSESAKELLQQLNYSFEYHCLFEVEKLNRKVSTFIIKD